MSDPLGFWVTFVFSGGVSFCGGWWTIRRWSQVRHLQDTPTSKIRSAAQGYVELNGHLLALQSGVLRGPLTSKACVWWSYRIEQRVQRDKTSTWHEVESGTSTDWLLLQDSTGQCLIDPAGAEVFSRTQEVWGGNLRHPLRAAPRGFLGWLKSGTYRYTERRLEEGECLFAIGEFETSNMAAKAFNESQASGEVIREWKQDFAGLLHRFDGNRNGQLDEYEWLRVQQAAKLEARERQRKLLSAPDWSRLRKPELAQPFVLSSISKQQTITRLWRQSLLGAAFCMAGFLACVWLLKNI